MGITVSMTCKIELINIIPLGYKKTPPKKTTQTKQKTRQNKTKKNTHTTMLAMLLGSEHKY